MGYLSCRTESSVLISPQNNSHSQHHKTLPNSSIHNQNDSNNNNNNNKKKKKKIEEFTYRELEAATDGFSDHKLLGKGSHGLVYKAVLGGGRLVVAVKKPNQLQKCCSVENEINILSNIQNPRLVNLIGFTTNTHLLLHPRLLVVEFMSNGTLYQTLHSGNNINKNNNNCNSNVSNVNNNVVNWGRRIRMALQTAKAIDDLHSSTPPVIHRDIKSANVLIDSNFNARLGDFGLALRCGSDGYHLRSTPPAGTMGYLDPCYVTPDSLSTKTDVFSFGILLLEIISGRKAIDVNYSPPSIVDWAIPLIRRGKFWGIYDPRIEPPKDPSVRKHLAVIAAKCVRSCRERRPTMKDVVECLSALTKLVPLHSWNAFTNPCMMVETIGMPVGESVPPFKRRTNNNNNNNNDNDKASSVAEEEEEESLDGSQLKASRSSRRRVYSDLGFRNNFMDLMSQKPTESRHKPQMSVDGRISRFRTTELQFVGE